MHLIRRIKAGVSMVSRPISSQWAYVGTIADWFMKWQWGNTSSFENKRELFSIPSPAALYHPRKCAYGRYVQCCVLNHALNI
jgi:hypothetical protein